MIARPIFVIGSNRSGTTLLFRNLSIHPTLWSLYVESQREFYKHWPIDPLRGDRVTGTASPAVREALIRDLYKRSHNKEFFSDLPVGKHVPTRLLQRPLGRLWKRPPIRLVEKTPANTLRIPMLADTFPDARFLFIVRRGEDVVSSLMEGWKNWSHTIGSDWTFTKWHYVVPPGWQDWTRRPLAEICAFQWSATTKTARADLDGWAADRYLLLRHEDLVADPVAGYRRISEFCELVPSASFEKVVAKAMDRVFTSGGSVPRSDKWKILHREEILSVRDVIESLNSEYYDDALIE